MPAIFEDRFVVRALECDPWDRMTPRALLGRIQEASTAHCEALGLNDEVYQKTHTVFLLSKVSLAMHKAPVPGQEVHIRTQGYGMTRAVYTRTTMLCDANGEQLCDAVSRWVLVDTSTNRILRKEPEEMVGCFADPPPAIRHDMQFPKVETLVPMGEWQAGYSLCDRNGHLNNAAYADVLCDHLPLERLAAGPVRKMLLHYHAEIPLGQAFALAGAPVGTDGYYFAGGRQEKKDFEGFVII